MKKREVDDTIRAHEVQEKADLKAIIEKENKERKASYELIGKVVTFLQARIIQAVILNQHKELLGCRGQFCNKEVF